MKQALKKLKGSTIATKVGQIFLKQYHRQEDSEWDQMYYLTSQDHFLVKLYDMKSEISTERFYREQQAYWACENYPQFGTCLSSEEIKIKKNNFGLILLGKLTKQGSLKEIGPNLSTLELLKMTETVLQFIICLKQQNKVFLNLKPQNIVYNTENGISIINPEYLSQEGSHTQIEQSNQFLLELVEKEYKYFSPELLEQYLYIKIDYKTDLFALGCILYEIAFGTYPFASRLAAINLVYSEQQGFFSKLIKRIFVHYNDRVTPQQLLKMVQAQQKSIPEAKQTNTASTNQSKVGTSKAPANIGLFDNMFQNVINKYTKQTESWYLNYTEDRETEPDDKYLQQLIHKLYKNQSKIEKLEGVIKRHIKQNCKPNFLIKNLLLIFNLMRRANIFLWQPILGEILANNEHQNVMITELVKICGEKLQIHSQLSKFMRGNFFIEEILNFKKMNFDLLKNLTKYLQSVIKTTLCLLNFKKSGLKEAVINILCDEIYDLISTIVFMIIAFRKDNQLQLRNDTLTVLGPIETMVQVMLKKISNVSNFVSSHPIYNVESDYMCYKEEIVLKETPFFTSLEYFYQHNMRYKGLAVPLNFTKLYTQRSTKKFSSGIDSHNQESPQQKQYFNSKDFSEEEDSPDSSEFFNFKEGVNKNKTEITLKEVNQLPLLVASKSSTSSKAAKTANLFGDFTFANQLPQESPVKNIPPNKSNKEDFQFFADFLKPAQKEVKITQQKTGKNQSKNKQLLQFQFFNFESNKKSEEAKKIAQNKMDITQGKKTNKVKKEKSSSKQLGIPNNELFTFEWLKKSEKESNFDNFLVSVPVIEKTMSPLIKSILDDLRLKELKDMIPLHADIVIEFEDLKFDKKIGSGSAGEVYLGKHKNKEVAIKKVKTKENPNALKQFQRELLTYMKIKKNPYLVSLSGLSKSNQDFYLLTEFCSGGSLFHLLHQKVGQIHLSWKQKINIGLQIAKGTEALHSMSPAIIHRDLKSLNVFMLQDQDNEWVAKVADFGLSRNPEAEMMTMALGTLHWMAPQLLDNKQYSLKVDVYSFAIVLWEICARRTPYHDLTSHMAIMKYVVIEKKRPHLKLIEKDCPAQLIELIQKCWDDVPQQRPNFKQIIQKLEQILKLVQ